MGRARPTEPPASERRDAPRVLADFEVDYKREDTYIFAFVSDLSATGIFVRTSTPEPPGTRLNLRFRPAGGPSIEVEGEVIWVKAEGMGVRFVDPDFETRDRLRALVRRFTFIDPE